MAEVPQSKKISVGPSGAIREIPPLGTDPPVRVVPPGWRAVLDDSVQGPVCPAEGIPCVKLSRFSLSDIIDTATPIRDVACAALSDWRCGQEILGPGAGLALASLFVCFSCLLCFSCRVSAPWLAGQMDPVVLSLSLSDKHCLVALVQCLRPENRVSALSFFLSSNTSRRRHWQLSLLLCITCIWIIGTAQSTIEFV